MRTLTSAVVALLVATAIAVAQQSSTPLTYQSPSPFATAVSAQTHIILRPGPALDRSSVDTDLLTVTGSVSGACPGTLTLARDGRTMTFRPERPFAPGETVTVSLETGVRTRSGEDIAPTRFTFTVDRTPIGAIGSVPSFLELELAEAAELMPTEAMAAAEPTALDSVFPHLEVTVNTRPAPGDLFITPMILGRNLPYKPHVAMVDNAGATVFRQRTGKYALDFKKQWNGQYSWYCNDESVFLFHDSAWTRQRAVTARGGAYNDGHDLLLLPNGNVLIMVIYPRFVDMSKLVEGGDTAALVLDIALQEIDPDDNLVFEWRSIDHFTVFDARHTSLTTKSIDHIHPNSIHIDDDGNILLSARHLDAVTKISRETGEIMWHLGGRNNQFRFVNDSTGFGYQHDARRLPNGNILLYDNGNHREPAYSRAVEYKLDMDSMTATVVWEYRHPDGVFAPAMGGAQRLPNGNTLIGWGVSNYITEVDSTGEIVFEMKFPRNVCSYRVRRFVADEVTVPGVLVSPADTAADQPRTVELVWDSTARTDAYHIEVASDREFRAIVFGVDTTGTRVRVPELDELTVYYWRVRPIGERIRPVWSSVRSFMTQGTWAPQRLIAPADGSAQLTAPPTLRWEAYAGATAYRLQVGTNALFADSTHMDLVVSETFGWLAGLDTAARYYWRVSPIVEGFAGPWSETWAFSTSDDVLQEPPQTIELLTPAPAASFSKPGIEFTWQSPSPMVAYRLQLAADAELGDVVLDTIVADPTLRIEGRTLVPASYWWRVRGTDELGGQVASPISHFSVATWLRISGDASRGFDRATVRPVPASTTAELELDIATGGLIAIDITDVTGRIVCSDTRQMTAGPNRVALAVEDLAPGVYTCSIRAGSEVLHRRLVVAR